MGFRLQEYGSPLTEQLGSVQALRLEPQKLN
jgi:hypothetical protein